MSFFRKVVNTELSKMLDDLIKEKRALEIETMEQDCLIRSLRAQLKLQSIAEHRIKQVIK
jgi:hypothetical protein